MRASLTAGVSRFHETKAEEIAILRTVLYASLFEYPLTLTEVQQTLIESSMTSAEILRTYQSSACLRAALEHREGCFVPVGRRGWIAQRRRRESRSWALINRHRRLLGLLKHLPFVRMVALSGSVAALNADGRADLDLFVITRGARVWLVGLLVVVLSKLVGKRRLICLNYVLSDEQLPIDRQDLFAANQIIQLRPLSGADAFRTFVAANPFVARFYPNFRPEQRLHWVAAPGVWERCVKPVLEAVLAPPSRLLDVACRAVYGWHLRRRSTSWRSPDQVTLGRGCLKLHTQSHRRHSLERFERLLATYLSVY